MNVEMARGQGQRMSGAQSSRINNMVVNRQQQQGQAMAQSHQPTVAPSTGMVYITAQPVPLQYSNQYYYQNKHVCTIYLFIRFSFFFSSSHFHFEYNFYSILCLFKLLFPIDAYVLITQSVPTNWINPGHPFFVPSMPQLQQRTGAATQQHLPSISK